MVGAYAGMILVMLAFGLETRGVVSSRSFRYLAAMATGQILLGIRAYDTGEWPFAVLSAVWAVIAIVAVVKPQTQS